MSSKKDAAKLPDAPPNQSMWTRLRDLDRKFAWSFLGVVLALIFGAIAIYTGFFQERKPKLKFEMISNTAVLDVKENIGNLDILYAGNNIKESGQTLSIITLRVINDGQQDILKNYYDENDPLGFVLLGGAVVERPQLIYGSNDYITKNLKLILDSPQKVLFSNIILEQNEFYTLKLLVLHKQGVIPDISPIGKIAGVKSIEVSRPYSEANNTSFISRTFGGRLGIQALRLVSYGLSFILLIILLGALLSLASGLVKRLRRRYRVWDFKRLSNITFNQNDDYIFRSYLKEGYGYLARTNHALSDPTRLERELREEIEKGSSRIKVHYGLMFTDDGAEHVKLEDVNTPIEMLETGVIELGDEGLVINDHMKTIIDSIMDYIVARTKQK